MLFFRTRQNFASSIYEFWVFSVDRTRSETVYFKPKDITILQRYTSVNICVSAVLIEGLWMPSKTRRRPTVQADSFTFIIKMKGWVTASRQSISTCKCQKVVVVINKASCFILTRGCGPPVGKLSENSRSSISSLPTCRMFVCCIKCPSASDYTTFPHNLTLSRGGHRRIFFFFVFSLPA